MAGKSEKRISKNGTIYYYSPTAGAAYRAKLKEAAIRGGYQPKPRGMGLTQKKVSSKTGATYYYQPWASLSPAQKADRLAKARESSARIRQQAAAYRQEHGLEQ